MADKEVAFYLVDGGLNQASPTARLPDTQLVRASNVIFRNELASTRMGCRILPMDGDSMEHFRGANWQGTAFYNPGEGQSAKAYGSDEAMLFTSIGGRKFAIHLERKDGAPFARIEDVTGGFVESPNSHLVWLSQWENFMLAQDANGSCWIWDGENDAFVSGGYIPQGPARASSMVPNRASVMAYAHGRGVCVVNGRAALVGDNINFRDQNSAKDVLNFTEAVYWATGQFFSPPTRLGAILAAAVLPIQDEAQGQGDLLLHCERGIFSVNLNVFPRSAWSNTPLVKEAYRGGGAAGPYAITLADGDQIFRSQAGIQTVRSARAEAGMLGSPMQPISDGIRSYFSADEPRFLRFASVTAWPSQRRIVATCYPMVNGRHWRHRGIVSLALDPVPGKQTPPVFESLWTVPVEAGRIVQTVGGTFERKDRFFALCRSDAGQNCIVEFDPALRDDVLADGTRRRIRSQIITRRLDCGKPFTKKNFQWGTLYIVGVEGVVDWGVWYRVAGEQEWKLWRKGCVDNGSKHECEGCGPQPTDHEAPLGDVPNDGKQTSRYVQFLVRWAGRCSMESIRVAFGGNDPDEGKFDPNKLSHCIPLTQSAVVNFNDYEYAEDAEADSWLGALTKP